MDEEETTTNNSVEHNDDHGWNPIVRRLVPGLHVDVDIMITEVSTMTNVQFSIAQGSYRYSLRHVE